MSRGREDSAKPRSVELIMIDIDEISRVSEHHDSISIQQAKWVQRAAAINLLK